MQSIRNWSRNASRSEKIGAAAISLTLLLVTGLYLAPTQSIRSGAIQPAPSTQAKLYVTSKSIPAGPSIQAPFVGRSLNPVGLALIDDSGKNT
jgi:hypothetical protein